MSMIGWAGLAVAALLFFVNVYAAFTEERRRRARWEEWRHPPDQEVRFDDDD